MTVHVALPPALLLVPLAALVLLAVHRRAVRPRELEVSSLLLWGEAPHGKRHGRGGGTLSLRLWLQLAALSLLATGLAGPSLETVRHVGRRLIVLLDTSASMQAREGNSTRFALARNAARRIVSSLVPSDRAAIVSFSSRPILEQTWTASRSLLLETLDRLEPLDTPTDLEAALAMARALVREKGGRAELVVLSDERPQAHRRLAGVAIRSVRVGDSDENLGITEAKILRGPFLPPQATRVYTTVRNYSPRGKHMALVARLGGAELARWEAVLQPEQSRVFELRGVPRPGRLELELIEPDDLPVDDRASVRIYARRPTRTLLFSDDAAFAAEFERILSATRAFLFAQVPRGTAAAPQAARYDLAIFHRRLPTGWPKAALVIAPEHGGELFAVGGPISSVRAVDWNASHPVARHLDCPLSGEPIRARRLLPAFPSSPVLSAATAGGDVPIVWAGKEGIRRLVLIGFDLARFDLRREENLPLLVLLLNSLGWLSPREVPAQVVPTGYVLPSVAEVSYRLRSAPSGSPFPFARAGEYVFDTPTGPGRFVARLLDPAESRIARRGAAQEAMGSSGPQRPGASATTVARRRLAPFFYSAALVLLAAEWAHYYWRG